MHIKKQLYFPTPKDQEALQAYIEQLPPQDRIGAYRITGMTWNLLAEMVNTHEELRHQPDEAKDDTVITPTP